MGIQESDIGKQIKKVKVSTIVNRRTVWDLARALGGKQGTPTKEMIMSSHSGAYAHNYIIQAGGVVTNAEAKDLRFIEMKRAARGGEDPVALCGIDPNQPDTWAPQTGFSFYIEIGEKLPDSVPQDIPEASS